MIPARITPKLIIYGTAAVLATAILYPLLTMLFDAFFPANTFSLEAFGRLFASRGVGQVLRSTLIYVIGSAAVAGLFGTFLAWINVRTDGGIKAAAGVIPLLPIMIPPIGSALGYLVLFAPQSGSANLLIRQLFGLSGPGPINVNSMSGLVLVTGLSLAPVVYLVVSAALRNIDSALDEAARISGCGPWKTMLAVTLPLVLPAISSVALLVAIHTSSSFSFPFILGGSANITPISVYIYRLFSSFPARTEIAIAASVVLLIVVFSVTWLQSRLGRKATYARIGGKFSAPSIIRLGRWRVLARAFVLFYVLLAVLPVAGLLIGALQPFLGAGLDSWSFESFHTVLSNAHSRGAIFNSWRLGVFTATLNIVVIGSLIYFSQRYTPKAGWIEYVMMSPSVVPHIVVGVAFAITYSAAPFNLSGTLTLVLLAYCMIFLPEAVRSTNATLSQLNPELSEASHVFGAGVMRTFFRVVLPQARGGMVAGWLIIFFVAVNEVTASTFLGGFNSAVIGYVAIDYFANGRISEVAAITLVSTIFTASFVLLLKRLIREKV